MANKYYLKKTGFKMLEALFAEGIDSGETDLSEEVLQELRNRGRKGKEGDRIEKTIRKFFKSHPIEVSDADPSEITAAVELLSGKRR